MSEENSAGLPSTFFSKTEIRVLHPRRRTQSNFKSAYIVLSSRIYWKEAKEDGTNQPQSLLDFRNANSLKLVRLNEESSEDVDGIVKVDKYEEKMRITVRGCLHGRKRRNKPFLRDVKLEIIPDTPKQHQVWMSRLRARIAPWNLLQQEMKDAVSRAPSARLKEPENATGGLATDIVGIEPFSMLPDEVEEQWTDILSMLPEQLKKLSNVDQLTSQTAAAVASAAAFAKLAASAERMTETAEFIVSVSTGIAGVSAIFQLVSLGAKGVSMCVRASLGRRILPIALGQIMILLQYVMESLPKILMHSRIVNETAVNFVFDTLKETVYVMDLAETQLLGGRGAQIVNGEDVKKVEEKIEELRHIAVTADNTAGIAGNTVRIADNTSMICAVDAKVNLLEEGREIWSDGPHHVPPSVSAFFSGLKEEMKALKDKLEKRGRAVVTQYGGMGKTESTVMFADRAERDKLVPGGIFWVAVDGDARDVIVSLAGLGEELTKRKMSEDERRNANLVITTLKQGQSERQGR